MAYLALNSFPGTGAVMQVAISFAGNRPDAASGSVPYFDASNVKAEIVKPATPTTNEVVSPTPLVVVNATTFKTTVIVPLGSILRIYRETKIDYPLVDFVDRQTVTENDLDTSSRQVLYAAMEALDKSNLAIESARSGLTFAVTAVNTANAAAATAAGAVQTANSAAGVASSASSAASSAVTTANSASAAAAQAAKDAASAEKHATNVETLAAKADAASANALQIANAAKATAEGIDGKATAAVSTANTAKSTADTAKATADGIDAKATSAVNTANAADQKAASAKATAEAIDAKATAAQSAATAAGGKADTATSTANAAKTTADGLSTKVDAAQAAASAAQTKADQANQNANERVAKAGDTMTGELAGTSFRSGALALKGGYLQNSTGTVTLTLNAAAVKTVGATNFELSPGDTQSGQFIVYAGNGSIRGNLFNAPGGGWCLTTKSGKNYVFGDDGRMDMPGPAYGEGRLLMRVGERVPAGSANQLKFLSNGTNFGIQNGQGNEALQVNNGGNNAAGALMSFHREGSFAAYFGLDTDNQWAVGGWSMGQRRFLLWHEGNFDPPSYVRYDNLRQELGGRGAGEVGTVAMLWFNGSANPGDIVGGGSLFWGSYSSKGPSVGYGNWRLCGYIRGDNASIWLRIN